MGRMIGCARESGGLYFLENISSLIKATQNTCYDSISTTQNTCYDSMSIN